MQVQQVKSQLDAVTRTITEAKSFAEGTLQPLLEERLERRERMVKRISD